MEETVRRKLFIVSSVCIHQHKINSARASVIHTLSLQKAKQPHNKAHCVHKLYLTGL